MFEKFITIWLYIITNVLSHEKCGHSMIPSAQEMGIETKTYNLKYGNLQKDSQLSRRRMGVNDEGHNTSIDFGVDQDIDYNVHYQNINSHSCDDIKPKQQFRIYVEYAVMEYQERKKFHADGPLSSLSDDECNKHVDEIIGAAKQILSPVVNYYQDHFSLWSGPVQQALEIEFDWFPIFNDWKGKHTQSYDWSWWDSAKFNAWSATHRYTHGQFDIILYVINDDHYPCGNGITLAWAFALHRDQFGRPTSGVVNFCNFALSEVMKGHYLSTVNVLLHEVGHILVLSDDHIPYFNIPAGVNLFTIDENNFWLTTPHAQKTAREFWNCSTALGIPLENQGGSATMLAHFEERYLLGEMGTGINYDDRQYVSPFFYALAQDSGWYCVRIKSGSTRFTMGKGYGCDWINKPCVTDTTDKSNFHEFFCDGDIDGSKGNHSGCTFDGHSIAKCILGHGSLKGSGRITEGIVSDGQSWIFDLGPNSLSNKCPWYNGILDKDAIGPQLCIEDKTDLRARCIESTESNYKGFGHEFGGHCYIIDCPQTNWDDANNHFTKLKIIINVTTNDYIECGRDEFRKPKQSQNGKVTVRCPSIDQYCPNSNPFQCEFGSWDEELEACICDVGFMGQNCTEVDDCIITYSDAENEKIKKLGLKPCSDGGQKRETLVGMFHKYPQRVHHQITTYPPHTGIDVDVTGGDCATKNSWSDVINIINKLPFGVSIFLLIILLIILYLISK